MKQTNKHYVRQFQTIAKFISYDEKKYMFKDLYSDYILIWETKSLLFYNAKKDDEVSITFDVVDKYENIATIKKVSGMIIRNDLREHFHYNYNN